jgi:hypothetical protein
MSLKTTVSIEGISFYCERLRDVVAPEQPGLFVILCAKSGGGREVIDAGSVDSLAAHVRDEQVRRQWIAGCPNTNIWVGLHPMPQSSVAERVVLADRLAMARMQVEQSEAQPV